MMFLSKMNLEKIEKLVGKYKFSNDLNIRRGTNHVEVFRAGDEVSIDLLDLVNGRVDILINFGHFQEWLDVSFVKCYLIKI